MLEDVHTRVLLRVLLSNTQDLILHKVSARRSGMLFSREDDWCESSVSDKLIGYTLFLGTQVPVRRCEIVDWDATRLTVSWCCHNRDRKDQIPNKPEDTIADRAIEVHIRAFIRWIFLRTTMPAANCAYSRLIRLKAGCAACPWWEAGRYTLGSIWAMANGNVVWVDEG